MESFIFYEVPCKANAPFGFYKTETLGFFRTIYDALREKCPYSKFFWSLFSRIRAE